MRSVIMAAALFCATGSAFGQTADPRSGVYRAGQHEIIVAYLTDIGAPTLVDFPSGSVRVLRDSEGAYAYGSTIGGAEDAGRLIFNQAGLDQITSTQTVSMGRVQLRAREVRFTSGDHELAGTLTLPAGEGSFPGVVLVHGGGPQTRDFWWVVPFFASRGVAVLAYDKQGVGGSSGNWQSAGLRGLAADATAAIRFARSVPEIDSRRVGLYGSSNGGWVAPLAARDARPAFIIARSASALPELDNIAFEVSNDLDDAGFSSEAISQSNRLYRLRVRAVRNPTESNWERYRRAVMEHVGEDWFPQSRLPSSLLAWNDDSAPAIRSAVSYWRDNGIDPPALWRDLRMPILIQIGSSDRSIPGPRSSRLLTRALRANDHAIVRLYDSADHALFANASGRTRDIPQSQGLAPGYLTDLDAFIRLHILEES